jgi:hypothetical protein
MDTTSLRPRARKRRFRPPLIAILLLAPIVGAIIAWLSMRGEHAADRGPTIHFVAPVSGSLVDAGGSASP